ncbi:MAG: response regulator transcription factor [Vicingaceae bacterium]
MRKSILIYSLIMAVLIILLKVMEYNFLVKSFSQEVYIGITAAFFTVLGVWAGIRYVKQSQKPVAVVDGIDEKQIQRLGLSEREMEVLNGMAEGLSNKEIAEQLFLSESTIKTHAANLFSKLDVKRRTQAVQRARSLSIID